jgi:uncharacterized protein
MNQETIYVDTSAFYALMDRSDTHHQSAKSLWPTLLNDHICLQTSNYVISETLSLIQYRLGFDAASLWYKDVLAVLDICWVDPPTHRQAYELWMSLGRQKYSLVDCISYVIMHQSQIDTAFCFKPSYDEQGFKRLTPPDNPQPRNQHP